jgi:hypothetical protein
MASAAAAPPPAKYHLLEYSYVADILEKRGPYRADHLAAANKQARGMRWTRVTAAARRRRGRAPASSRTLLRAALPARPAAAARTGAWGMAGIAPRPLLPSSRRAARARQPHALPLCRRRHSEQEAALARALTRRPHAASAALSFCASGARARARRRRRAGW